MTGGSTRWRARRGRIPHGLGVLFIVSTVAFPQPAAAELGDPIITRLFLADQLELAFDGDTNPVSWDVIGWVGSDWNRLWFKSEGETSTTELGFEGEAQLLYSRLVAPFWELQVGVRGDVSAEGGGPQGRGLLVLGVEGLARYWFEFEAAIFVSHRGDVSARVQASYDLFITQRLIAQPSFEVNVAVQEVPEFGVGAGFNDLELGLRLRYEIRREFAPYVGINWRKTFMGTAELLRDEGQATDVVQALAGVRFWF